MTRENEPTDGVPDNVIAFPKAKAEKPPEEVAETAETPVPEDTEEPTMTLDAFERAVRAAVQDKLGDEPASPPRGADELVAQVFSALTGKDAKTALAEVRARLAEPDGTTGTPSDDADVIDLGAVREARQKQSLEAASKVGNAIKDTLSGFIANLAQRQGHTGEITLDTGFFKQHGPALIGNLFQSLASAFMQQAKSNLTTEVPPPSPAPESSAEPNDTSAPSDDEAKPAPAQTPVNVRLDLGSLFSGLFKRLARPPQPEPPSHGAPTEEPPKD